MWTPLFNNASKFPKTPLVRVKECKYVVGSGVSGMYGSNNTERSRHQLQEGTIEAPVTGKRHGSEKRCALGWFTGVRDQSR
ncbi:hypothetical protein Pmani_022681 [Petrolisthes manimaculis]|uniref:Uncharacterized protein n=1 Tax=Petrolisthes manimaculis TaxID=1843537 RepID=A0AAE1PDG4_9EUCA|nr:hypothetical protein Pmani_022681 [Petrolisthes manimaculis]